MILFTHSFTIEHFPTVKLLKIENIIPRKEEKENTTILIHEKYNLSTINLKFNGKTKFIIDLIDIGSMNYPISNEIAASLSRIKQIQFGSASRRSDNYISFNVNRSAIKSVYVLTSYFSWIWGPAWAMYNVLAVSNTSSKGILVTRCLAISWQFKYKVTSVVDTLMTILDHFLVNFGTVNFATSSECECKSELV